MLTLAAAFDPKRNNIDALRLAAAVLVLIAHSWPLTGAASGEPVTVLTGQTIGGGSLAVAVFFVLSGFLVTKSALNRTVSEYMAARVLRIVPALAVVSVFDVVVIGLLFTTLPLAEYFSDRMTWEHLTNFRVFPIQYNLPGVFAGGDFPHVNGSLWTLPIESAFYLLLPPLALAGLLSRRTSAIALVSLIALGAVLTSWMSLSDSNRGPLIVQGVQLWSFIHFGSMFALGSLMYVYAHKIPISGGLLMLIFLATYATHGTLLQQSVLYICIAYTTFFIAVAPRSISMKRLGDLSYGTYVFAWPVQKAVIFAMPGAAPVGVILIALPLTLALAYISWHMVEKPALALRRHFASRSAEQTLMVSSQPGELDSLSPLNQLPQAKHAEPTEIPRD